MWFIIIGLNNKHDVMSIEVERSWWLQKIILEHCHDKPGAGHMIMNKATEPCNQILLVASTSTGCIAGCGLLSYG